MPGGRPSSCCRTPARFSPGWVDAHVLCNGTQPGLAPFLYESSLLERKLPPAAAKEILDLWNAVAEVAIDDCSARDMSLCLNLYLASNFHIKRNPS